MDGTSSAIKALGEVLELRSQLRITRLQPLQTQRLAQAEADQTAKKRTRDRFADAHAEHQTDQHENPLHALCPNPEKEVASRSCWPPETSHSIGAAPTHTQRDDCQAVHRHNAKRSAASRCFTNAPRPLSSPPRDRRADSGAKRTVRRTRQAYPSIMIKPRLIAAAEIDRLETWAKYTADMCHSCMSTCCTMPVEVRLNDLIRLELVDEFERSEPPKNIAKRLQKDGIVERFNQKSGIFTLIRMSNNDCLFLDRKTRLCTVYEKRPDTCRHHPKVGPRPGYCAYKPK